VTGLAWQTKGQATNQKRSDHRLYFERTIMDETNFESLFIQSIVRQFDASLCTLGQCLDQCPESIWDKPVARFPFSQSIFHAMFYADLYLGKNIETFKAQAFHQDHALEFGEYEQLESAEPTDTYQRTFLKTYLQHCRDKVRIEVPARTAGDFDTQVEFSWLDISRAEMHVYNIRHIQHHAAQLILKLRLQSEFNSRWVKSGWTDAQAG